MWAWGNNFSGQLGDGTNTNKSVPTRIGSANDWLSIKGGRRSSAQNHSIAIKTDGSLWAWGSNGFGQLGDGTSTPKNSPILIGQESKWQIISSQGSHTLSIKSDGSLWAWGANHEGQLGDGLVANPNPFNIKFNLLNSTPIPTGQAAQAVCIPATLSTLVVTGTAIKWYEVATGGSPLAIATPLVTNKTYYASQTLNDLESKSRLAVTVTVNTLPAATITASGPITFCEGGKVILTASAGSRYLWSTGATTQSIDVNASGNYTVEVTNASGCKSTSLATTVTVNTLPAATITASGPINFCEGGKVILTASAGSSYLWSTGATTQSIEVSTSGKYSVKATNVNGCTATSAETIITVNPLPLANITPEGSTTITQTGNVILRANTGNGQTYQWFKDKVLISSAVSETYTATSGGSYTVKVINSTGCETISDPVVVKSVFVLPANNFQVNLQGETCRTIDDGKITIKAVQNLSYIATLTKAGQIIKTIGFNANTELTNLAAGNYTLCFTVAGQTDYKQCFDLVITEPQDLSVYSKVNPKINTIDLLMNGGDTYYITLNGERYTSNTSKMSLGLKSGLNKITVSSSQICQGVFNEEIYIDEKILAYPNPFSTTLNLKIENQENKELLVKILDRFGISVYQSKHLVINNLVSLDLSNLENDYYFVVIGNRTFKVIKR